HLAHSDAYVLSAYHVTGLKGVKRHVELSVVLVAGVLRKKPEALPPLPILHDDRDLPETLDAVSDRLGVIHIGVADFTCQCPVASPDNHRILPDRIPFGLKEQPELPARLRLRLG